MNTYERQNLAHGAIEDKMEIMEKYERAWIAAREARDAMVKAGDKLPDGYWHAEYEARNRYLVARAVVEEMI